MTKTEKGIYPNAKKVAKEQLFDRIAKHPLIVGCAELDMGSIELLFGGYWNFVLLFPDAIQSIYDNVGLQVQALTEKNPRQASRYGRLLSGSKLLSSMKGDEINHRLLWEASAGVVGINEDELDSFPVLPTATNLISDIKNAQTPASSLIGCAAVEIVATGISRPLLNSSEFCKLMGKKGMAWFHEHKTATLHNGTTHEDVALSFAGQTHRIMTGNVLVEDEVLTSLMRYGNNFIAHADALRALRH